MACFFFFLGSSNNCLARACFCHCIRPENMFFWLDRLILSSSDRLGIFSSRSSEKVFARATFRGSNSESVPIQFIFSPPSSFLSLSPLGFLVVNFAAIFCFFFPLDFRVFFGSSSSLSVFWYVFFSLSSVYFVFFDTWVAMWL